ncbi:MAG: 2-isopropylmalate synthase [Candidatus Vogelbacteria bacterium]|nr:2-isopropylmalate synthase [Candidatus Vogelbacteria bacterium]
MKSVLINDITLRDGEQAAGVNFFPEEKLRIARQLVKLRVPIMEAGFPIASEQDAKGVELVANEFGRDIVISAMCRAVFKDIDVAAKALGDAPKRRIQVVMGTSDIHLKHKFNLTREDGLKTSVESVAYALKFSDDVEFAAEDASRSDLPYLVDVCVACVKAGAKTIELPDTVGYATPEEYFTMVAAVVKAVPPEVVVATHCHNDLGLATINTIAGIMAGARQAEVTINGIGERVGNAASEEVIMTLKTRKDFYQVDIDYINSREIMNTSKLIEELSQIKIAHNKAIVGKGAFLHESGIHQDGLMKSPQTYQVLDPKDIGLEGFQLVIGKLSGKNALNEKLSFLKIELDKEQMKGFSRFFKDNAAKKKFVTDADVINLYERWANK